MIIVTPAVRSLLTADAAVTALVSTRIYPDILPQNPTLPALAITTWFVTGVETTEGPSGFERHRVQLDAYATSRATADEVMAAVDAVLCRLRPVGGPRRTVGAVAVQAVIKAPSGSPPTYEDETNLYRRSQDFFVTASAA